jgi:hypothetical protein
MNSMRSIASSLRAEGLKLRRSPALRLVWLLPVLFILAEWLLIERPFLGARAMTPKLFAQYDPLPVRSLVALWGGFFHPLMLAILPALIFRPEHRFKTWRHLHAMPLSRRGLFLAKALWALLLCGGLLALVGALLLAERALMGRLNPVIALPSHRADLARVLAWLWLASLPLMGVYLWVSDRISNLAVPVVLGLVGLLLAIALMGQEQPKPWKRDLIPWVLPYAAVERFTHAGPTQQGAHPIASVFEPEPNVLRLPSGKKVRTWQNVPDEVLFPPPPPTPAWLFALFSLIAGAGLLGLGTADAGRNRL